MTPIFKILHQNKIKKNEVIYKIEIYKYIYLKTKRFINLDVYQFFQVIKLLLMFTFLHKIN